ncbi:MAG TPA: hypothetical protein VKB96_04150, partial [Gammaproteobacteria bacterium]|nr:hypothetical protein [Gammaproteobacteria bacterium]
MTTRSRRTTRGGSRGELARRAGRSATPRSPPPAAGSALFLEKWWWRRSAWCGGAGAHTTIDGVRELRSRGLTAANLQRMTVRMSNKGHSNIGWPYSPGEVITAQMNGFYAAAVTLLDGDAFIDQYAEA